MRAVVKFYEFAGFATTTGTDEGGDVKWTSSLEGDSDDAR